MNRLKDLKALIVEDDLTVCKCLSGVVSISARSCTLAESAEAELKLTDLKEYDVVFCDYELPGLNGVEFFERFESLNKAAINILMSAHDCETIEEL